MIGEMLFTYQVAYALALCLSEKQADVLCQALTAEELLPAGKVMGNAFSVLNWSLTQMLFSDRLTERYKNT